MHTRAVSTRPLLSFKGRYRDFHLRSRDLLFLVFYAGLWVLLFNLFPHALYDINTRAGVFIIGIIGLWRYGWWMFNFTRAQLFGHKMYPAMRRYADQLWPDWPKQRRVHFLMTTFCEQPDITHKCLESIIAEIKQTGISATLWICPGSREDEEIVTEWLEAAPDETLEVTIVRQNQPGKRVAIGLLLRALSRSYVRSDDIAVLMDGDSIVTAGCMQKCLSLLHAFPSLRALTTDEDALCRGPAWMQEWLSMRFAQRRMWMQAHALSRRVLTLTGRFSVFRAPDVCEEGFIRMVEADYLNHWFWGRFRFLSGDDKSTWFYLLMRRAEMTFVPDAMIYTIEHIEGNAIRRAFDNILRWSGNMLRNGMRAIQLGPTAMPFYIWWCLVDQRITIVTTLLGFFTMLTVVLFVNAYFIFTYILWIMLTRLLMSSVLFGYAGRIHMSFPLILYCNQLILAFTKAWLIFRLPSQRWANRMDQRSCEILMAQEKNRIFPLCQNLFYMTLMVTILLLGIGVLKLPEFQQLF